MFVNSLSEALPCTFTFTEPDHKKLPDKSKVGSELRESLTSLTVMALSPVLKVKTLVKHTRAITEPLPLLA